MKVPKHKKTTRRGIASQIPSGRICSNCHQTLKIHEGHFFPPSLGDSGFFICSPIESIEAINKNFTRTSLV
jgi:hypothetical protein